MEHSVVISPVMNCTFGLLSLLIGLIDITELQHFLKVYSGIWAHLNKYEIEYVCMPVVVFLLYCSGPVQNDCVV